MLSKVYSAGVIGIEGFEVTVECSAWNRLPKFELVGLPDAAVKEAKNRVQSASENSGIKFPSLDIMINLAPADVKKMGSALDLAILLSIYQADGIIPFDYDFSDKCVIGELSLSGDIRAIGGVLPMTLSARDAGKKEIFVPKKNAGEAAVVEGIRVYGVSNIRQLLAHVKGQEYIAPMEFDASLFDLSSHSNAPDFSEVRGQLKAKRALEIAAAGGHNVLMIGPPGAGKSMLAKRLGGILPDMSFDEAVETTKIQSVTKTLTSNLVTERPFRSPHHTVTVPGLCGGGSNPKPGEISLAHNGVLFLDELPEFSRSVSDSLRQPLEDGSVTVTRAAAKITYPSSFMLVCAMNPCKCGYFGDPARECTCSPAARAKYLERVSGPLLDRIDIQIELPSLSYDELSASSAPAESSAVIRERVARARRFALDRMQDAQGRGIWSNAQLDSAAIRKYCVMDASASALLKAAYERMGMSARGYDRIMRVARTIADMDASDIIKANHIAEAIQYRSLDKKYWG